MYHEQHSLRTNQRTQLSDITADVRNIVKKSGIKNGLVSVSSLHTTAGITINENADPDVVRDILWKLKQLIAHGEGYHHAEGNADSHIKASVVGPGIQVAVIEGRLELGTWQSIYFCEFDGPRSRRVSVTVMGD